MPGRDGTGPQVRDLEQVGWEELRGRSRQQPK
jgi:hypothetical protein